MSVGRGAPIRLNQINVSMGQLDAVFITHFHSDHLNGLPDLWMTGYLPNPFGYRARPMELWGPTGTVRIAAALRETFRDDIRGWLTRGSPKRRPKSPHTSMPMTV